ncbi:unnamed protein product, partial [Laminaria digitata]
HWRISSDAALSEVKRLVSEGVPVMTRNSDGGITTLQYPDAATFSKSWGHRTVDVGSVSYARNFKASKDRMTLKEYDATV